MLGKLKRSAEEQYIDEIIVLLFTIIMFLSFSMGIRQLTSYIKQNGSILYSELLDLNGMNLVIDGNSLYYTLMKRVPGRFGGDYFKLYACFREFFEKLTFYNIKPFIILDGGLNIPLKTETICERIFNNISVLDDITNPHSNPYDFPKPILTQYVFIEVLQQMGINFVVAKKEADLLIVAFANRLCCPVVTGDSDFYVTNVHHGVISMDGFMKIKSQSCHCFKIDSLCQHLKLQTWMLPFLAVIMGNDYSSEEYLLFIQKTCGIRKPNGRLLPLQPRMQCISEYLRKFASVEEVILSFCSDDCVNQVELRNEIENILLQFDINFAKDECDELFNVLMRTETISRKDLYHIENDLESFLLALAHQGLVDPSVIDIFSAQCHFVTIQCENVKMKCSSQSSQTLRKYVFAILLKHLDQDSFHVTEYRRAGKNYRKAQVEVNIKDLKGMPNILSEISSCKLKFLCDVLEFSMKNLEFTRPDAHIFLICTRYWIKQTFLIDEKIRIEHLYALLISFLHFTDNTIIESHAKSDVDLVTIHYYSRWQSIVHYVRILNDLLERPVHTGSVKFMFNGTYVHHIYHQLIQGESPHKFLDDKQKESFEKFIQIICEGLQDCIQEKFSQKVSKAKKKSKPIIQKGIPNLSNRFAGLMVSDGEDDED